MPDLPAPLPTPVRVVLPLPGEVPALLSAVEALVAAWPAEVEGRLVVPSRPLVPRDRRLLAAVEGDVVVRESDDPGGTFGDLVALGGRDSAEQVLLVVADHDVPSQEDLRAVLAAPPGHPVALPGALLLPTAVLDASPVLSAAHDLAALTALATALHPAPAAAPAPAAVREPTLSWPGPARRGMVTVVVPVWNQLEHTRACIRSLRRSTRAPYEVVVVDNGSTDGTREWLAAQRDLRVVTNAENLGFAAACNQGIAAARGEIVVLLNNDTAVPRFWVEGLLRAFTDPEVAAVGPRSNAVSGHQLVPDVPYTDLEGHRAFADRWRRRHAGQVSDETRLVGFCLALRRDALEQVGGLDEGYGQGNFEDDDLCLRLRRRGWRLAVAHEVLVHHAGSATFAATGTHLAALQRGLAHHRAKWTDPSRRPGGRPLLSAALIVRDEQRSLPRCLASLRGVVDEVVVCDTGSTDRTVEIATALGARVVTTAWRDDFAAARNVALDAAAGEWVLSIDADETLVVAPGSDLKVLLLGAAQDGLAVEIRSQEQGGGIRHMACRLLRKDVLRWRGVVHETPVRLDGERLVVGGLATVHLDHDGYLAEVYAAKDKAARNLDLAERNYARDVVELGGRWRWKGAYELARALSKLPDASERVEQLLRESLELLPPTHDGFRAEALVRLCDVLLKTGRPAEAEQSARASLQLRPGNPIATHRLACALAVQGRDPEALRLLDALQAEPPSGPDLRNLRCEQVLLPALRGQLLAGQGRAAEAVEVLVDVALRAPDDLEWPALWRAARDVSGPRWGAVLGRRLAPVARALLAAAQALPEQEQALLHEGLAEAGLDPAAHTPEAVYAAEVDEAVQGFSPEALAAAAADLEAHDPRGALHLWARLPASAPVQVAQARCHVALGDVAGAVAVLDGLQVHELDAPELLVVAAVAAHVGDGDTALAVLAALPPSGEAVAQEAYVLASTLGDAGLDALPAHVRDLVAA